MPPSGCNLNIAYCGVRLHFINPEGNGDIDGYFMGIISVVIRYCQDQVELFWSGIY